MSPSPSRHFTVCMQQVCADHQAALTELRPVNTAFETMQGQRKPITGPAGQVAGLVSSEAEESCRVSLMKC